jgi:hypothetical protein
MHPYLSASISSYANTWRTADTAVNPRSRALPQRSAVGFRFDISDATPPHQRGLRIFPKPF